MITLITWGLIGLTGLFALIQICYYLFVFSRFAFDKPDNTFSGRAVPVSVIISAKNELKYLKEFLPSVLAQNYGIFEVIVVNDGSWDDTAEYIENLMLTEPKLRLVDVKIEEKYYRGKKIALALGIKAASYDWLLFTDADTKPVTENWISEISRGMTDDKEIVIGYTRFKRSNNALNLFIRLENYYLAMQYLSFALKGNAFMGVGKNLAYRKSLFFKVKGFASHQHIMAGDDELFVNETATPNNTAVIYSRESFMETQPKLSWKSFWTFKKRHFYTTKFYKTKHQSQLGVFNISQIFFYICLTLALVFGIEKWIYIVSIFGLRFLVQCVITFKSMDKLRISKIFGLFWLFDILLVPYYLTVGFSGLVMRKIKG